MRSSSKEERMKGHLTRSMVPVRQEARNQPLSREEKVLIPSINQQLSTNFELNISSKIALLKVYFVTYSEA